MEQNNNQINQSLIEQNQCFVNLSNVHVPPEVVDIVTLGPKFNKNKQNLDRKDSVQIVKNVEFKLHHLHITEFEKENLRHGLVNILSRNRNKTSHVDYKEKLFQKKLSGLIFSKKNTPK